MTRRVCDPPFSSEKGGVYHTTPTPAVRYITVWYTFDLVDRLERSVVGNRGAGSRFWSGFYNCYGSSSG